MTKYDIMVCAVFKNESHILDEWIQHYKYHGVSHIVLVNDGSTDDYLPILEKHKDFITVYENHIVHDKVGRQMVIANHFFLPLKDLSTWIAVLDLDEFLYSPTTLDIKEILSVIPYDHIQVDWLHFGSNDHVRQPHSVVEGFLERTPRHLEREYHSHKMISKSAHVRRFNIHHNEGTGNKIHLKYEEDLSSQLIINHYNLQSRNFYLTVKQTRGDCHRWFEHVNKKRNLDLFLEYDKDCSIIDTRLFDQNLTMFSGIKTEKIQGSTDFTVVLTSCNRPHLLAKTLASFFRYNTYPPKEIIIIDDSGVQGCNDKVLSEFSDHPIVSLYNSKNIGQVQSIDKAYSYVTTPYIFHCEEDWEFTQSGFIEKSKVVLDSDPLMFTVWLRAHRYDSIHPVIYDNEKKRFIMSKQYSYRDSKQNLYTWHGITFNPGLRNTRTMYKYHPYMMLCDPVYGYLGEYAVNVKYGQHGYYSATLEDSKGHVRHIGGNHHIPRPWEKE
jgi:glycosyltransferase involved in cell wall biosynthesis